MSTTGQIKSLMVAGSLLVAHVTAGDKASLQLIMINLDEIETAFPMQAAV